MLIGKNPSQAQQGGPSAPKPPATQTTPPKPATAPTTTTTPARPPMSTPPVAQTPPVAASAPPATQQTQMIQTPPAKTTALATRSNVPAVPAFVEAAQEGEAPVGFENVGNEAFRLPMLSIAQAQSPQVTAGQMNAGDCYLTTDREHAFFPRGAEVVVLPFFYYKSWDRWNHRDLGGGLIDSSVDPMGPNARMAARQLREYRANPTPTAQQQPERAVESIVFLTLFKDVDEQGNVLSYTPVAIPFAKSKYKKGALWMQLAMKASQGKYPIYQATYVIKTVLEQNKRGAFYNFDVDFAAPEDLKEQDYHQAKQAYQDFKAMFDQRKLQIQLEDDSTPEIEAEATVKSNIPEGV